ncbi:hypothetical protein [Nocardia sp. NPDC052112]|uniref:hypothetical protein n=1 Tax=Nocardia sp. NPDC052112 TaxID=3155646 RepID=UPI003423F40E
MSTQDRCVRGTSTGWRSKSEKKYALVGFAPWLVVVLVLIALLWAGFVAIVLLAKVLSAPDREIAIRIRMMPWPRIDIDAKASSSPTGQVT